MIEGKIKTRRRLIAKKAHVLEFTCIDEDIISPTIHVDLERPIGKKVENKQKV